MPKVNVPEEFLDYIDVLMYGAQKYGANDWEAGKGKADFHQMHYSMLHHLGQSITGSRLLAVAPEISIQEAQQHLIIGMTRAMGERDDDETNQDTLLHLITRAQMCYTLIKRGKYGKGV